MSALFPKIKIGWDCFQLKNWICYRPLISICSFTWCTLEKNWNFIDPDDWPVTSDLFCFLIRKTWIKFENPKKWWPFNTGSVWEGGGGKTPNLRGDFCAIRFDVMIFGKKTNSTMLISMVPFPKNFDYVQKLYFRLTQISELCVNLDYLNANFGQIVDEFYS